MRKWLLIIGILTASTTVQASVVFDSSTISGTDTAHTGHNQFTHTVGTGLNRILIMECYENLATRLPIASATVNGSLMQFVHRYNDENGLNLTEIWMSTNPSSGLNTVDAFFGGPAGGASEASVPCAAITFENVNLTDPIDISSGAHFSGTLASLSFTTSVSSTMLVDIVGEGTNGAPGPYSPGTGQILTGSIYAGTRGVATSIKQGGVAGVKTMSWTLDNTSGAQAMIALKTVVGAPELATISPVTAAIGIADLTLTITGTNFVAGATVTWNGSNLVTTFVNSTQLTAVVPAANFTTIGSATVQIVNPDTARTGTIGFTITGDVTFRWVTDGGYKPTQEDTYGIDNSTTITRTRIWDGATARPFQAKNEINGFVIMLENGSIINSTMVSVGWPVLTGPNGYVISSTPAVAATMWDWRNRPIEMYMARYLPIQGISTIQWDNYDEQHLPERMQATYTVNGNGQGIRSGDWTTRRDHDKHYPDILIPWEVVSGSTFTVAASSSQAIWVDIYVPKDAPAGVYTGQVNIYEGPVLSTTVPIELTVYPFTMPDKPYAKPYTSLGTSDLNRYAHGTATTFQNSNDLTDEKVVTHLHYRQFLHRFGIHTIGDNGLNGGCGTDIYTQGPCNEYKVALNGSLYSATSGYANAPGVNTPDAGYVRSGWPSSAWLDTQESFCLNANIWQQWFEVNAPDIEHWLYLTDEPSNAIIAGNVQRWTQYIASCNPPGNRLPTFITAREDVVISSAPLLTDVATTLNLRPAAERIAAHAYFTNNPNRRTTHYNGVRPFWGTMVTEDDGVAWRVRSWGQFKMKYDKDFIWRSNFWIDTAHGSRNNDLFNDARTFGTTATTNDPVNGRTSFQYQNGDGVLIYPGTNTINTADSYGIDAPIPSWRLMMWRRGINDFNALTMASQYDPKQVNAIVQEIIPKVLWEYGCFLESDCSYQYTSKSWSSDPNVWELARERLYKIISRHR